MPIALSRLRAPQNRLRTIIAEHEISLTELAALTAISYGRIRRIARPNGNPSVLDALRISAVLDVAVEDIFEIAPE